MDETSQNKTQTKSKAKKRDRCATEDCLLRAAEDIFSKLGFKAATTRLIAAKSKVNESLIGRYFDGKMGLLLALIEKHVKELPSLKLPYPPQETLAKELAEYCRYKFELESKKNLDFFKIVVSQCLVDPKFLKKIRETIPFFKNPQLTERLELLKQAGKIRKDIEVEQIVIDFESRMLGAILFEMIMIGRSNPEAHKSVERFLQAYVEGVGA